jgi:hypothetical protein
VSDSDNIDTLIWGLFNNNKPTLVRFVNHTQITILKDNNKFGDELICDRLDEETIHKYTQEIHDIKNVIILFDFMKTRYTQEDKYLLNVIRSAFRNYGNNFYESLIVVFFNAHNYTKSNQPVYDYNNLSDKLEFDTDYEQRVKNWYLSESEIFEDHYAILKKSFVQLFDSSKYTEISYQKLIERIRYCYVGSIKNDRLLPIRQIKYPFGIDNTVKSGLGDFFEKNKDTEWYNNLSDVLNRNRYSYGLTCQVVDYTGIPNISTPLIGTKPDTSLKSKCKKYKYSILGILLSCGIFTPIFIWFSSLRTKPTVGSGIGIFAGTFIISVIGAIVINNWNSCDSSSGKFT